MKNQLIIEIPNYITHVKLSNKRRARYYTKQWAKKKKIPKKYSDPDKFGFNKEGILVDKLSGEKVIANPKTVGTPRLKKINGQDFYNGVNVPIVRYQMVAAIKEYFRTTIKEILSKGSMQKVPENWYPVQMELSFMIEKTNQLFDVDNNSWIYNKIILDSLVDIGVLKGDTFDLVRKAGGGEYCEVPEGEQRQLIIKISPYKHTPIPQTQEETISF